MSDVVVEELTRDERKQLLIPPGVHADRVRLSNGDVIIVCGFYHIELDNWRYRILPKEKRERASEIR